MEKVIKELTRIVKPFDARTVLKALDGKATLYDVDNRWFTSHMGHPRPEKKRKSFDGDAMTAGGLAVCFLAAQLPVGDKRRQALPGLVDKIRARLQNPDLLLYAGCPRGRWIKGGYHVDPMPELPGAEPYRPPSAALGMEGREKYLESFAVDLQADNGALVSAHGYLYFRPALLSRPEDLKVMEQIDQPHEFFAFRAITSDGFSRMVRRITDTPVPEGAWEIDPRASAPELVDEAARTLKLDESAATLYLQLLALCDCGDAWLREVNGWKPAVLTCAGQDLVRAGLARDEKQPRANRKLSLPGVWEKLNPPHPAMEAWKLPFYDVRMGFRHTRSAPQGREEPESGDELISPLDRVVPLRPVHELFFAAWQLVKQGKGPQGGRTDESDRDWIAEIAADPEDDNARLVYADHLTERGDPRGELITLQHRRGELARQPQDEATRAELQRVITAEEKLIKRHGPGWSEAIHSHVVEAAYDRGFITDITVQVPKFIKKADAVSGALPLLRGLTFFHTGGIGRIPDRHIELLGEWKGFKTITRLDLTADHYIAPEALPKLLAAPNLGPLRWLRLGFHRAAEGFGEDGARSIAECERLGGLRFLEIAGQTIENAGALALVDSPHLERLEMLRLPFNAIDSKGGRKLMERLEAGALPALRVLDVGNAVQTDFVTKAVRWFKNRVPYALQNEILGALARRRGGGGCYEKDTVTSAGQRRATALASRKVLPQKGRFPCAEQAKSGRSRCLVCSRTIKQDSVRIGVERIYDDPDEGPRKITSWVHPDCRDSCPELQGVADLDARLKRNSAKGIWPPEQPGESKAAKKKTKKAAKKTAKKAAKKKAAKK